MWSHVPLHGFSKKREHVVSHHYATQNSFHCLKALFLFHRGFTLFPKFIIDVPMYRMAV